MASHNPYDAQHQLDLPGFGTVDIISLPALAATFPDIATLPHCLRIVLEAVVRHCDGQRITQQHVEQLAQWQPNAARAGEIPLVVARVVLQDYTGVPLIADLAAMRDAAQRLGRDPALIEPVVPVSLIVDHSVQIDRAGDKNAFGDNMAFELARNAERYGFLKWGGQTFNSIKVFPTGKGIVHQINLEHLARGLIRNGAMCYPDTLVGADSHTTMINGIGVVGWGVGGIEAEAAMLGQPTYFLMPDVIGVLLVGTLRPGVSATDLALTVTERLRAEKVVGKFVEFFGDGAASLAVPDRATLANMAPEYGATLGFFPVDEKTVAYLSQCGRTPDETAAFAAYFEAQQLFGIPGEDDCRYTRVVRIALADVVPSVAGPKRPQDRIDLNRLGGSFDRAFSAPVDERGYAREPGALATRVTYGDSDVGHGDVLLAAITSCTNTSNPSVMLAAGLLAQKAVEKGLSVHPRIKTTMAPGSQLVTDYLARAGLLPSLERLGFHVDAYGCTSCAGNVGALQESLERAVVDEELVCAAVLSGNRNFEARIHPSLRANYLMSPPLVIALAIAGTVRIDVERDPLGLDKNGAPVFLRDLWPTEAELASVMPHAIDPHAARSVYMSVLEGDASWNAITAPAGSTYTWPESTYIARPPFLDDIALEPSPLPSVRNARALAILGDSITTDHVSPVSLVRRGSPAGDWLEAEGVAPADFNLFGARRGHHEVMARGTFGNVRLRNLMCPALTDGKPKEGGFTVHQPSGEAMTIFEAATRYRAEGVPCIVFAGQEYGTGSSRDWAAKGPRMLGVRAVIARSFERIHRSNLIGMGILPLEFQPGDSVESLGVTGTECFSIDGVDPAFTPGQTVRLLIDGADGRQRIAHLILRVDTPVEATYCRHGGILPYVLRELVAQPAH